MNGIEAMVQQMASRQDSGSLKDRVMELSQTMSQRVVAIRVGVSRTTVFNILHAHRMTAGGNGRQGSES